MRRTRWLILLVVLTAFFAAPPSAHAQGNVAKRQYREAKNLYDNKEYQDALEMFQIAWEQSHSPNARLYIGRCFVKLGSLLAGFDELQGTLRDASARAEKDDKYIATRNAAAAELALLDPRIGRLIILLDDTVPNAKVTLNGEPFPSVKIGDTVAIEPGAAKLVASAEGKEDVVRQVTVGAGKTAAVVLLFPRADGATAAPPSNDGDGGGSGSSYTTGQYLGFALIGLGGVTLVLAAASGAAAASRFSAVEKACQDQRCDDAVFGDVIDTGKTFELLAYIGLAAGGAVALGGGAMVWLMGDDGTEQAATIAPIPGGGMLNYRMTF